MITNNFLVQKYYKKISDMLEEAGYSKENTAKALLVFEGMIYQDISEKLLEQVPADKQQTVDELIDEHAEPQKIIEALGIDEKQLTELYLQKLEEYWYNLNKNLPNLKQKLQNINSR